MKIFILSVIIFINVAEIFARQPAVLPGRTISTTKYEQNKIKPKNFDGYNFTATPQKIIPTVNQNINKLSKAGPQSISIYLTIFALLFPFGLWLINNKSLKDENDFINKSIVDSTSDEDTNDNVIELGTNNESSEDESEEQKKAS